jgi:hypothetical protein
MAYRLGRFLFICGLILLLTAMWKKNVLPPPQELRDELLDEPTQVAVRRPAFEITVGEITYDVQPLYKYELHGMVVSRHDSNTWWDYIHKEWNDKLNVADLCVVWGDNVRSGVYRDIDFSSGQFVCNFQTSSNEAYAAFDQTAISNNHLLTADPSLARKMRDARIGDQVHFSGYLAEYSHNHGFAFKRGTSTVRTDSGNGACETVYVEDFEILHRGGGSWHMLQWLGLGMMIAGVIAWFTLPVRMDY